MPLLHGKRIVVEFAVSEHGDEYSGARIRGADICDARSENGFSRYLFSVDIVGGKPYVSVFVEIGGIYYIEYVGRVFVFIGKKKRGFCSDIRRYGKRREGRGRYIVRFGSEKRDVIFASHGKKQFIRSYGGERAIAVRSDKVVAVKRGRRRRKTERKRDHAVRLFSQHETVEGG